MADESFTALLDELFEPLGGVRQKKMFGGVGIFKDDLMFALVADDLLYLKVDDTNQAAFEAEGCGPFVYNARGRSTTMGYWQVPERLYDEPDAFRGWAETAFAVAVRNRKPAKAKRRKTTSKT